MILLLAVVLMIGVGGVPAATADLDFATRIRPVLSDKCFACHGPDRTKLRGGLQLTGREAATRESDGVRAIVPGNPDASEMVRRLFSTDPDEVMPPPETKNPLTSAEKELLKEWIRAGAEYTGHWAFDRIRRPREPAVKNGARRRTSVDSFVLSRLEKRGFGFAPDAKKEKLIRRVSFDLTGLPPTIEEVEAFVKDRSPKPFEKVVDEYLSRETYGERMASEWMDVARYSDTYGYQVDRDRHVWPYRDWVIKAFNANKPYDTFVTEQVAGDLLPNATDQQILATTFNRLHPQKVEGGSVPEEFRVEYVSDRIQTFATAFLGLTMECCKCHAHKYDPISQEEYYSLASFFDNIDEAGLYSFFTPSVPTPTLLLIDDAKKKEMAMAEQLIATKRKTLADAMADAGGFVKPDQPTVPGLVGYYDFETGSSAVNTVNANHAAVGIARNKIVDGRNSKAVRLTGDDEIRLALGNFTRNDPFTISLWMKSPKKFPRAVVFHRSRAWTDAASRGHELLIEDGRLSAALIHFYPGNALRVQTKDELPLKEWVHVTMAYDGSSKAQGLKLYVNGRLAEVVIVRDKLTKNITGGGGNNITIGARFRDRGFKGGSVDDFKVFNRQLTAAEAAELFSPGHLASLSVEQLQDYLAATESGLVGKALAELKAARAARGKLVDNLPEIMVMREMETERPTYFLHRGAYDQRRQQVPSGTPAY